MKKLGKVVNDETKVCEIAIGDDIDFYKSVGYEEIEVEQAYNGDWYLIGYVPKKPEPTKEEIEEARASRYVIEVDPITNEISRLRDEPQSEENDKRIADLIILRNEKVNQIKTDLPYPEEPVK